MKDVKIVFIDFDNTLTKSDGSIDTKNSEVFRKLADKGVPVVITTGRSIQFIVPKCKQNETSNYVITSNGAEIYNYANNNVIYQNVIEKENLAILDEFLKKYNLIFMANTTEKRYSNKVEDALGFVYKESLSEIDVPISQVVFESYDIETMKYLRRDIEETNKFKIVNKTNNPEQGKLLYYDVVNNDVSKGNAIKILCEHLNININRSMAIGDGDNDVEMISEAGVKVAVGNATESVKGIADIITLSNDQNGVATILEELNNNI